MYGPWVRVPAGSHKLGQIKLAWFVLIFWVKVRSIYLIRIFWRPAFGVQLGFVPFKNETIRVFTWYFFSLLIKILGAFV